MSLLAEFLAMSADWVWCFHSGGPWSGGYDKLWDPWPAWDGVASHASFGQTAARTAVGARSTSVIPAVSGSRSNCSGPSSKALWTIVRNA